jgi:hypothetical protein
MKSSKNYFEDLPFSSDIELGGDIIDKPLSPGKFKITYRNLTEGNILWKIFYLKQ